MSSNHADLKRALFERDGWRGVDSISGNPHWYAMCAGDCGRRLTRGTATVDRYPVPGAAGGTYHLDNTRLACAECNTRDGMHDYSGPSLMVGMSAWQKRVWKRALRRAEKPVISPFDVFGKDYEPGQDKPLPSTPRAMMQPVMTGTRQEDSRIRWTRTDWNGWPVWICRECGATGTGAVRGIVLEARSHWCYDQRWQNATLELLENLGIEPPRLDDGSRHNRVGLAGKQAVRDPAGYVGRHRA